MILTTVVNCQNKKHNTVATLEICHMGEGERMAQIQLIFVAVMFQNFVWMALQ